MVVAGGDATNDADVDAGTGGGFVVRVRRGGNGIAPLEDLLMLLDRESRRGYGNAARHHVARHHVAHDLGISERTVRRRRDRTLNALRQASDAYLATVA